MININIIEVKNVYKEYNLYNDPKDLVVEFFLRKKMHKTKHALKNISFNVKKGECFGVLGSNGSGKSTILSIINGTTIPTRGEVILKGSKSLLSIGGGILGDYTGIENIYYKCGMMGLTKKQTDAIFDEIVEFSEIGEYLDQPAKKYSSGMKAKLGFAISVQIQPEILIVDEALSVGDQRFHEKCDEKINEMIKNGMTIMFVSHSSGVVKKICNKAAWIESGELICCGNSEVVCELYENYMQKQFSLKNIKEDIKKGVYNFD